MDPTRLPLQSRRMISRLMAIICLSLMIMVCTANESRADFDLCQDPPLATMPDSSASGWLRGEPDWVKIPDIAPNPFDAHPKAGIADVYGYNFDWKVYDLGCGNDALRDPQAVGVTSAANVAMEWPTAWAALESRLGDLVHASPMKWVQGMIAKINGAVASKLWNVWFPVSVVAAGGWIILRSRRANYADTSKAVGVVLIVAAASIFLLNYPTRASNAIDKVANTATAVAASPFTGTGGSDAIARDILYPQWLQGEFGSATSPTATKYGPDLYWATHYTWSEYKQVRDNQKNRKVIDARKGKVFERIAKEIEQNDPVAYTHVTGKDPEARLQAAIMAYPFIAAATLFMMVSLLMLAVAKVMLQALVIVAPVLSIPAVHPKGWGLLMSAWNLFTAALFAAIKFAFIGGLFSLFLGAVLTSGRSPVEQLFWLVLITIVAFAISRPFRTLKSMTPGLDANRSYLRDALHLVSSFAGARLGSSEKEAPAPERSSRQASTAAEPADENAGRSEDESLPPLPPPPQRQVRALGGIRGQATPPEERAALGVGTAPATYPFNAPQVFNDDEDPAAPAPLPRAVRPARPIGVAPIELEEEWQTPLPVRSTPVSPAGRLNARVAYHERSRREPPESESSTEPEFGSSYADRAAAAMGPDGHQRLIPGPLTAQHRRTAAGSMATEDGAYLYRSADVAASEMAELRPAEVQIDAEGNETHVIYRSGEPDA